MRRILLFAFIPAFLAAAPAGLEVVKPVIAQMEGGDAMPADTPHTAGETLFFSARIAGFTKSPEEKIHLKYSVQAVDPKGVAISEPVAAEIDEEIGPQDKEWMPKIELRIEIPPVVLPGAFKVNVKVEDLLAKANAELALPFTVRGRDVPTSPALAVRNFQWFHNEDEAKPMAKPVYHAGDAMWMKFDIVGYKYGDGNKIDVNYTASLVLGSGKTIWSQPEPAAEQSEGFYPKPYITGEFGISLQKNFQPGTYIMRVIAKDVIGKQTFDGKFEFLVQ